MNLQSEQLVCENGSFRVISQGGSELAAASMEEREQLFQQIEEFAQSALEEHNQSGAEIQTCIVAMKKLAKLADPAETEGLTGRVNTVVSDVLALPGEDLIRQNFIAQSLLSRDRSTQKEMRKQFNLLPLEGQIFVVDQLLAHAPKAIPDLFSKQSNISDNLFLSELLLYLEDKGQLFPVRGNYTPLGQLPSDESVMAKVRDYLSESRVLRQGKTYPNASSRLPYKIMADWLSHLLNPESRPELIEAIEILDKAAFTCSLPPSTKDGVPCEHTLLEALLKPELVETRAVDWEFFDTLRSLGCKASKSGLRPFLLRTLRSSEDLRWCEEQLAERGIDLIREGDGGFTDFGSLAKRTDIDEESKIALLEEMLSGTKGALRPAIDTYVFTIRFEHLKRSLSLPDRDACFAAAAEDPFTLCLLGKQTISVQELKQFYSRSVQDHEDFVPMLKIDPILPLVEPDDFPAFLAASRRGMSVDSFRSPPESYPSASEHLRRPLNDELDRTNRLIHFFQELPCAEEYRDNLRQMTPDLLLKALSGMAEKYRDGDQRAELVDRIFAFLWACQLYEVPLERLDTFRSVFEEVDHLFRLEDQLLAFEGFERAFALPLEGILQEDVQPNLIGVMAAPLLNVANAEERKILVQFLQDPLFEQPMNQAALVGALSTLSRRPELAMGVLAPLIELCASLDPSSAREVKTLQGRIRAVKAVVSSAKGLGWEALHKIAERPDLETFDRSIEQALELQYNLGQGALFDLIPHFSHLDRCISTLQENLKKNPALTKVLMEWEAINTAESDQYPLLTNATPLAVQGVLNQVHIYPLSVQQEVFRRIKEKAPEFIPALLNEQAEILENTHLTELLIFLDEQGVEVFKKPERRWQGPQLDPWSGDAQVRQQVVQYLMQSQWVRQQRGLLNQSFQNPSRITARYAKDWLGVLVDQGDREGIREAVMILGSRALSLETTEELNSGQTLACTLLEQRLHPERLRKGAIDWEMIRFLLNQRFEAQSKGLRGFLLQTVDSVEELKSYDKALSGMGRNLMKMGRHDYRDLGDLGARTDLSEETKLAILEYVMEQAGSRCDEEIGSLAFAARWQFTLSGEYSPYSEEAFHRFREDPFTSRMVGRSDLTPTGLQADYSQRLQRDFIEQELYFDEGNLLNYIHPDDSAAFLRIASRKGELPWKLENVPPEPEGLFKRSNRSRFLAQLDATRSSPDVPEANKEQVEKDIDTLAELFTRLATAKRFLVTGSAYPSNAFLWSCQINQVSLEDLIQTLPALEEIDKIPWPSDRRAIFEALITSFEEDLLAEMGALGEVKKPLQLTLALATPLLRELDAQQQKRLFALLNDRSMKDMRVKYPIILSLACLCQKPAVGAEVLLALADDLIVERIGKGRGGTTEVKGYKPAHKSKSNAELARRLGSLSALIQTAPSRVWRELEQFLQEAKQLPSEQPEQTVAMFNAALERALAALLELDSAQLRGVAELPNLNEIMTFIAKQRNLGENRALLAEWLALLLEMEKGEADPSPLTTLRYDNPNDTHLQPLFAQHPGLRESWVAGASVASSDLLEQLDPKTVADYSTAPAFDSSWLRDRILDPVVNQSHIQQAPYLYEGLQDPTKASEALEKVRAERQEAGDEGVESLLLDVQEILLGCLSNTELNKSRLQNALKGLNRLSARALKHPELQLFFNVDLPVIIQDVDRDYELQLPSKLKEGLTVDTDDPYLLLRSGTDVAGSCQNVHGSAGLNQGVVGLMRHGKNRMIAILSPQKKILARSLLRLMADSETGEPVLLLEPSYYQMQNKVFRKMIERMAKNRAEELGLPLCFVSVTEGEDMTLASSFSNGSPEYFDSAKGIQKADVHFTVSVRRVS